MVVIVVRIVPHSSIPYKPKVSFGAAEETSHMVCRCGGGLEMCAGYRQLGLQAAFRRGPTGPKLFTTFSCSSIPFHLELYQGHSRFQKTALGGPSRTGLSKM